MAIALDATGASATAVEASPMTWTHVCTGSNLVLIIAIRTTSSLDSVTAVTYNGVSASRLKAQQRNGNRFIYLYGLVAPATGSHTVSVTMSGGGEQAAGGSVSYTGVSQTGLPDASNSASSASTTSMSTSVTTIADNCWVTGVGILGSTFSAYTNATQRNRPGTDDMLQFDSNGPKTPAGAYSIGFTQSGAAQAAVAAVSLAPSTAVATTASTMSLMGVG